MRYVVVVLVGVVLVPVVVVAGALAATAIVGEWLNFQLLDLSNISLLDWLAGGPGAGANSFENYLTFMISGLVSAAGFTILKEIWTWATAPRRAAIQRGERLRKW